MHTDHSTTISSFHHNSHLSNHTMSKGPNANADFQNQYNAFKESLQQLSRKIGEIEGESEEHK